MRAMRASSVAFSCSSSRAAFLSFAAGMAFSNAATRALSATFRALRVASHAGVVM